MGRHSSDYQEFVELRPLGPGAEQPAAHEPLAPPRLTWRQRCWKGGNLAMQFQPYFLMWYGFWLIVNDLVEAHCDAQLLLCTVDDHENEGLGPVMNATYARDMFSCPHTSFSDSSGQAAASFLLIAGLVTAGVVGLQLYLMLRRVRGLPPSSLRYIAWLEVAKERGGLFMRLTQVSALIIVAGSVVAIFDKVGAGGNFGGVLNVTFQGGTSLYTAYLLVTYESPVQTKWHARNCPNVPIAFDWYDTSADVMVRLHYILALDRSLAQELIGKGGGDVERTAALLRDRNLSGDLAGMLAGFGHGDQGRRALERVRQFLSHPPTQAEMQAARGRESAGLPGGAEDPGGADDAADRYQEVEAVVALQATVDLLNKQCSEAERRAADAEGALEAERERGGDGGGAWEATVRALNEHCAELERRLEEAPDRDHCDALEATVAQLNARCADLERQLAALRPQSPGAAPQRPFASAAD
eukprot:TRINITY_DN43259_c0_g1_i1.p1 TRINITY_DN43259_c0_g1~~TRINITY_DN43259_c0_g1_i1.p1  ORF type:complete len:498 (+),score=161.50 TRINITY_DN43259_c0_g1_i1:85-1494(+)